MIESKSFILFVYLGICLFATSAIASISPVVNFQGLLTDSDEIAVEDGNYTMTFSLWDGENENPPNNLLWENTQIIPIERGVYSVSLGPFPYTITFAEQYYVSIQVNGGDYLKTNNSFIPINSTWTSFRSSTSGGRLVNTVSQNYTVTENDDIVLVSGNTTIELPEADSLPNRIFTIKKIDSSNSISIETTTSETVDGIDRSNGAPIILTGKYDEISLISDGQNWLSIHLMPDYSAGQGLTVVNETFSIQQESIVSNMIANDAITDEKLNLDSIEANSLALTSTIVANTGSLTALNVWGQATINTITSEHMNLTTLSLSNTTLSTASPGTSRTITIPNNDGVIVVTSNGSINITTTEIQDSAVITNKIKDSAVITNKIADDAITTSKISDGTITGNDLNANLVLSTVSANVLSITTNLAANTASLTNLTLWGVATLNTLNAESASLTSLSLGNATIAVTNPGNAKTITIPDSSGILVVTSDGSFSVTTTDIQDSAVITNKIADDAITTSKISDGTITASDLSANLSLSTVSISDLTVSNTLNANTASLTSLALSNATIAVAGSGNAKTITIPDSTGIIVVTSDGSISISSTDIQNSAITTNKIADSSVTSSKISDGTITGNDLNSTLNLSAVSVETLTINNTVSGNTISLTELTVYGIATMNTIEAADITVTGRLILPDYNANDKSDGQITWDSTDDAIYIGTGSGTTKINNTFTTYTASLDSTSVTVPCSSGNAIGGGCSTNTATLKESYPTCSSAKCTNNVTTQNGWHCTFDASNSSNSAYVICAD